MNPSTYFRLRVLLVACVLLAVVPVADASFIDVGLVGIDFDSGALYDVASDASISVIGHTNVPGIGSLELGPGGLLYGFTVGSTATGYAINPSNADVVLEAPLDISSLGRTFEGGLVFVPVDDRENGVMAYAVNGGNEDFPSLFKIVTDGVDAWAESVGTMDGGQHDIGGLGWRSDGKLIGLDRVSNALIVIDPLSAHTEHLADVPEDVGSIGGMVIINGGPRGDESIGFFSTAGPGATFDGSNELYSFDPYAQNPVAPTPLGVLHPRTDDDPVITGSGIGGLAIIPEPMSLTLLAVGGLTLLRRRRRW